MTLSTLLLATLCSLSDVVDWSWYGQPSAVIWKDQLFTAINGRVPAPGALYRGTFNPGVKGIKPPIEYWNPNTTHTAYQAKLDIRDNRLLLFTPSPVFFILPMEDVPALEPSEFGETVCRLRGHANQYFLVAHYGAGIRKLVFPPHRKPDFDPPPVPIPPFGRPTPELVFEERADAYIQRARCDLQIAGAKSVRLFHAYKDKLFISTELDYLSSWFRDKDGHEIKNPPPAPDRQLRTGKLPADFTEYFAAYTSDSRDYLVTDNGKVYLSVPKGMTEVEITTIWNDPKRVIVGVVKDLMDDAVFGWGFAGKTDSPERFYVKLDPKPVAVAYKLTVPLWNDRSNAYLESYECARAFRADAKKNKGPFEK